MQLGPILILPRQWREVLWNDERRFYLFRTSNKKLIHRPVGMRFDPQYHLAKIGTWWWLRVSLIMGLTQNFKTKPLKTSIPQEGE